MPAFHQDPERKVIPRWREFETTLSLGELFPSTTAQNMGTFGADFLTPKLDRWNRRKSVRAASELVGAAIVLGHPQDAREAAEFLISHDRVASDAAVFLAQRLLHPDEGNHSQPSIELQDEDVGCRIRFLRGRLRREPRDAFLWMDLGRSFVVLGLRKKGLRAVRMALNLAPASRFVRRAASRFFVHAGDFEQAHDILRRAPGVLEDPWLLAGEIAVAATAERTSALLRRGKAMLDKCEFQPLHVAELASAIATVELAAGKKRRARQLFAQSLVEPTENSIAQVEWASRQISGVQLDESNFQKPFTFEALAHKYQTSSQWKKALSESRNWLHDQPFSSRPAILGSYLAAVILEDFTTSIWFAKRGLKANPQDFVLLNNFAFSLAQCDKIVEAEATLTKAAKAISDDANRMVFTATSGFIAYRAGKVSKGQLLYKKAIDAAHRSGQRRLEAMAFIFWALEEMRARTPEAAYVQKAALDHLRDMPEHERGLLESRLSGCVSTSVEKERRTSRSL